MAKNNSRLKAIFLALFVTFLWSTSWVLIKLGLGAIPALTFAGLRYSIGFLVLAALFFRRGGWGALKKLTRRDWLALILMGVFYYALTQGAQFLAMAKLPAVTVNLLLGFSAALVALGGIFTLGELPGLWQWVGIVISLFGAVVYFHPIQFDSSQWGGFLIALVGVAAGAVGSILSRGVNRGGKIPPLTVTTISMGVGGLLMLAGGAVTQGVPALGLKEWAIILWLAVINTALAFTLWNITLQELTAVESSVLNNTMMVQVPILAVIFLGEVITLQQGIGMLIAVIGTLMVQVSRRKEEPVTALSPAERS